MNSIIEGRAKTTTYTHDTLIGRAKRGATPYDVTEIAHELFSEDDSEAFDLKDLDTLLPHLPELWLEYDPPLITNVGGRLELANKEVTGVAGYLVTADLKLQAGTERRKLLSFLNWGQRRRVRRARYCVAAYILIEVNEGGGPYLIPPVVANYHYLNADGKLVLDGVVQHLINAVQVEGSLPDLSGFMTYQYPFLKFAEHMHRSLTQVRQG